ncbi:MAG: NfeD family protein [Coriobacteriia bacterium]|nr:NfeD family protein [Coriobacteriia bacterium]
MADFPMFDPVLAVWGSILFIFLLVEMLQLRGNFFSFALGAAGALVCWALGLDIPVQAGVFVVVSALSFFLLRPLFIRKADKNSTRHAEGIEALVGLDGQVIQKVDGTSGTGRVDIDGRPVKAIPVDRNQKYNVGDHIEVVDVEDDFLVVRKYKKNRK